ncbi:mechanosensitive ion channel family protein [Candidatus Micrarchaeota archaeon]|nr:mechanosensitive ion channel family protein [Candidatus Micrarchaeota archaeon]
MKATSFIVYMVIILIVIYSLHILEAASKLSPEVIDIADKVIRTALIILIVFGLLNFIEEWMKSHFKLSEDERRYFAGVMKYLAAGLVLLLLGFVYLSDISSLTLFSGLVGAGVAIAVQPTLLNVVGWASIVASRLYRIGDRVFIGDSMWGALGDVSDINLFFTRINELDRVSWQETGGFVSVPNKFVLDKGVINYTTESPFIWDEISFRIAYGSDYRLAKKLAEDAVKKIAGEKMKDAAKFLSLRKYKLKIKDIAEEPITYVSLGGGSIRVAVRYLVAARKKRQAEAQITENLLRGLNKNKNRIKVVG